MVLPPLVIPGAFLVTLRGSCNGKTVDNVIGVTNPGTPVATPASIATIVGNAWKDNSGPMGELTPAYTFLGVHVVDLSSTTGGVADVGFSAQGGKSAGDLATMASCALIKYSGGTRQRRGNGRMYIGPLMESQINSDGRTLGSGAQSSFATKFQHFNDTIGTAGLAWVVLSRKYSSHSQPIQNVSVDGTIASQRRRLR